MALRPKREELGLAQVQAARSSGLLPKTVSALDFDVTLTDRIPKRPSETGDDW
ncbi:MAG: hypothetical protein WCR05_10835 [Sphaerochaetaceae bacterium]